MTRKQRLIASSVVLVLFLIWALVTFWLGPSEIARAHRGESLQFLNDALAGRATIPLQEYLAYWQRLATKVGRILLGAVLLGYGTAELVASRPGRRGRHVLAELSRRAGAVARTKHTGAELRLSDGLLVAAALGLATGAAEGFGQYWRRLVLGDPAFLAYFGPEVVWLIPLTTTVVFLLVGGALSLQMRFVWPRVLRTSYLLFPLLTLSLFTFSRAMFPRIAWWAVALLALGVATRVAYSSRLLTRHTIRRMATACVAVLVVAVASAGVLTGRRGGQEGAAALSSGERPNVLLIILDTVRAANLSLYGYERPTTPVLERLSARAVTFDMAFVPAPWTLPTHASFFTGRYPHETTADWLTPLDDTFPTLAEWFGGHGYATGGFVANLAVCGLQFGLDRGFEHYDDVPVSWRAAIYYPWLTRSLVDSARRRRGSHRRFIRKSANEVNRSFLQWEADTEQPFFAFLNYFDAHRPYGPPQDSLRVFSAPGERYWIGRNNTEEHFRQLTNAYDDGIHYIDSQIGVLLDTLRRRGVLENTLVVITSDHGEEFMDHGHFGHVETLYRQVLHVPLMIIPPGSPQSGGRVTHPVGLTRLAATITGMAGLAEESPFPGLPLPLSDTLLTGAPAAILSTLTAKPHTMAGDLYSLVAEGHHYIVGTAGREDSCLLVPSQPQCSLVLVEELYHLASDPEETRDLSAEADAQPIIESFRVRLEELLIGTGP